MQGPNRTYTSNVRITPGTPQKASGTGVCIVCTVAGNVALLLKGGTTLTIPVAVGTSWIDNLAVIDVVAAQTTATATVDILS